MKSKLLKSLVRETERDRAAGRIPDYTKTPRTKAGSASQATAARPESRLDCSHMGYVVEPCRSCAGELRHVRECDVHGRCSLAVVKTGVQACASCPDYSPLGPRAKPLPVLDAPELAPALKAAEPLTRPHAVGPASITTIDPDRLLPTPDGRRFNCSLIEHGGRTLLAYRLGWWGSRVAVAELGDDLQPARNVVLDLSHPECRHGQDDPRLFVCRGKLHVTFAGLDAAAGMGRIPQVFVAELADDLAVSRVWQPDYPARNRVAEKNWMPFGHGDSLYAVYWHAPWRVIRLNDDGTAEDAFPAYDWRPNWSGGELRGGCPPVRVAGELYHWFHGWKKDARGKVTYSVGVLTTDAEPPFLPRRLTPDPVWLPDESKVTLNRDPRFPGPATQSVIFPGGAVLRGDTWLVAAGHHDAECLVGRFDRAAVEAALRPVEGGPR